MKNVQTILNLMEYTEINEEISDNYYVQDIIPEDCKLLFILESPHTKEINKKYPLAGQSGENLSNFIYTIIYQKELKKQLCNESFIYEINFKKQINAKVTSTFKTQQTTEINDSLLNAFNLDGLVKDNEFRAFGEYIHDTKNSDIGIINICNIPMQSCAYEEHPKLAQEIKKYLEPLRKSYPNKNAVRTIHDKLIEIMASKIASLKSQEKLVIVCCGKFAEYFYKNVTGESPFFIYHPSCIFDNVHKHKIPEHITSLSAALEKFKQNLISHNIS